MTDDIKTLNDKLFAISQQNQNNDSVKGLPGMNKIVPGNYSRSDFFNEQQLNDLSFAKSIFGDDRYIGSEYLDLVGGDVSKYDENIEEAWQLQDINAHRAEEQSALLKGVNSIVGGALSGLMTAVEDFGYIFDFENHIKSFTDLDRDRDNWLSSVMRDLKADLYKGMPIYENESDSALGQFIKFSTLRGILDSMVGFAIPGGIVAKGVGTLGKATRLGALATKLYDSGKISARTKVLTNILGEGAKDITAGAISNYAEGQMMAIELGENAKNHYIESKAAEYYENAKASGIYMTEEEARKIAENDFNNDLEVQRKIGQEQKDFVLRNRLFTLTDAIALHGLVKSKGGFRQGLLKDPKEKLQALKSITALSADNPLLQAAKEAGEEIGQNVIQSEGEYQVRKATGTQTKEDEVLSDDFWNRALDFATSKQAIVEGLMGAVSGPGQRILSTVVANISRGDILGKERQKEESEAYLRQQEIISSMRGKLDNVIKAEALRAEAIAKGDAITEEALWNKEATDLIYDALENKTIESLKTSTNDIIANPNKTAEEKEQAKKLLTLIDSVENEYIASSDKLNTKEVFKNRIQHLIYQDWTTRLKDQISDKVSALNTALNTKSVGINLTLDNNFKITNTKEDIGKLEKMVPAEYKDFKTAVSQYNTIKNLLNKVDTEYSKIITQEHQKEWVIKEQQRLVKEALEKEKQTIQSYANKDLVMVDDSNTPIEESKAKLIEDDGVYYLRGYDSEADAFTKPLLTDNGEERPVTSKDLEKYKEISPEVSSAQKPKENIPLSADRKKEIHQEAEAIENINTLNEWKSQQDALVTNEEERDEIDKAYDETFEKLTLKEDAAPERSDLQEGLLDSAESLSKNDAFDRQDDVDPVEDSKSLWDSFKRTVRNYWFGSKGSEVVSRKNNVESQIRWYDFLDTHNITTFNGRIEPFKYKGNTAGRLVVVNNQGEYVDKDGNSIGTTFDPDKAIYTTVADPNSDPSDKFYGDAESFNFYKDKYLNSVWSYLEKGITVPISFNGVSTGIVDKEHKNVVKRAKDLRPLKESLPSNLKLENLTVYISTTGQIVTNSGLTFNVPAGSAAIYNSDNGNYYKANSVPINTSLKTLLIDLFKEYAQRSIRGNAFKSKSRFVFKSEGIYKHISLFNILKSVIRYTNTLEDSSRNIFCVLDDKGKPTPTWNIGGKEYSIIASDDKGTLNINPEFIKALDAFLSVSFCNINNSLLNPNSLESFYFPKAVGKNGFIEVVKFSNYHTFVKKHLVDFISDPNNPYSHAERYVIYEPLEVKVEEKPEPADLISEEKSEQEEEKRINTLITYEINGTLGTTKFILTKKDGKYDSDAKNKAVVVLFLDALNAGYTLKQAAKYVTDNLNNIGQQQTQEIQVKFEEIKEAPKELQKPSKKYSENPTVAALEKKLETTTDPGQRALLEKIIENTKKLNITREDIVGTQVIQNTKFSKIQNQALKDADKELSTAKVWFEKKFPGIKFNIVKKTVLKNVAGMFENSVVTIYKGASKKTVYHEAFHVITDCVLEENEKENLIKSAVKNKDYTHYFSELKSLYPELSQEELAEEVLAEAFADYMLLEDESDSIIKKIFRKIKELITSFYNIFRKDGNRNREWATSIETLVNHVRNTNNLTSDSTILKAKTPHFKLIPGLDSITTNDAVNSIHYWMIQYFKSHGNIIDLLSSDNSKLVAKGYEYAKKQFSARYDELSKSISTTDGALMASISDELLKIFTVLNTWDSPTGAKAIHQREKLLEYRLELTSEEEESFSADVENPQGRDSAALFAESITVNTKMNANKIIKFLLSTLPKKYYDYKTHTAIPYKNSLGMPEVEPFGKIFNVLANKLSNFPPSVSVSEVLKKMQDLVIEYPAISTLIQDEVVTINGEEGVETKTIPSWLKLDKADSWTAAEALQFIQFLQAFNNNKNQYLIGISKKNGQYSVFNASNAGQVRNIVSSWRSTLSKNILVKNSDISKFYTKDKSGKVIYNKKSIKDQFPSVPSAEERLKFLSILGINIEVKNPESIQEFVNSKIFIDKINNLYYQITKGTLVNPIVYENLDDKGENLSVFVNIQNLYGVDSLENSHISLENKRIYDLGKPGFVNQVINKLNRLLQAPDRIKTELNYLNPANNVYTTHSLILNRMLNDKNAPKLTLFIHEGNKEETSGATVAYKDMKIGDKYCTVFNLAMEGKDNILRPADNGQERFLDHGVPWVSFTTTKKDIYNIFIGYLWDELANSHSKDRAFSNFNKNYKKGTLIESLLSPQEIDEYLVDSKETSEEFANRVIDALGKDLLSSRLGKLIEAWTDNAYKSLSSNGVIIEMSNGTIFNAGLKISSDNTKTYFDKADVVNWIRHAVVNYAIGNIEQSKLIYGENVYYKTLGDEFKRHNGAMGTKKTCLTSNEINKSIEKHFKRMDKAEGLKDSNGNPILKTMIFNDVPAYSKELYMIAEITDSNNSKYQNLKEEIRKLYDSSDKSVPFEKMMTAELIKRADKLGLNCAPYADMTEGDGFGMISLDAYREFKLRVGDWSDNAERLYQWEVQERNNIPVEERVYKDFNGKVFPLEKGSWGNQVFNSLKPQHFGPLANVSGYKPSFYKLSLMPLIPSVLKSVGNTNLSKLHELMIKNKVSVAVHYSANKGVTTKTNSIKNADGYLVTNKEHPYNDFYDEQGNFLIDPEGNYNGPLEILTQDTYWESWGIQVDTGEHKHHDVVTGTQMMVQILNGLFDGGKVSDHFGEDAAKVQNLVDEYISLNTKRIELGREKLKESLGLVAGEKGWKISADGISKLVNTLKTEALERGLADNFISSIDLLRNLEDGNTNIDILPTREKIESILMSTAARMTTSQKRHGTAAYQVPSTMWETKVSRSYNEGKYRSSDLNFVVRNVNGKPKITSMEVYLPSPFKGVINTKQVPKELLELIGFRIPTQGLSSIETLIIKGFLPESAGDIIVLPSEIVAKAGSDYDIDKMYLYIPNFYKLNGKYKYINYANWEEQYDELVKSAQDKDQKENTFVNRFLSIFDNSSFAQELSQVNRETKVISKNDFYKKAIENRITQIQKEIAHVSANASNFIAPIQSSILEASATRAMKAVYGDSYETQPEYYKSKANLPSILDSTYVLQVSENYMAGKKEVGIAANAGKFYVYASMYDFGISEAEAQINFEHNSENGWVKLGRRYTAGNKKIPISELLNQWITAAVDAAKHPFGVNLGATPATLGTLTMLTMAGVHPDTIALFMNQPIIRHYLHLQQKYESQIAQESYGGEKSQNPIKRLNKDAIIIKLKNKYGAGAEVYKKDGYTDQELEEYILNKDYTYQGNLLDDFIRYTELGRNVADAMQGTTFDTKDGGKNFSELLLSLHKSSTAGKHIDGYSLLMTDKGFISPYKKAVSEYPEVFKPLSYLLRDNSFINSYNTGLMNKVIEIYSKAPISTNAISICLNKFKNDYLTTLILNTADAEGKTLISEKHRLMMGDNSVPAKLSSMRTDPYYIDNSLIQALVPILNPIGTGIHNIKPYVDKDVMVQNSITYAWEKMYRENPEFATDLMKFCLLQSGIQMSPLNFLDIIPAKMYKDYIQPLLDKASLVDKKDLHDLFIYAWQLANYNDANILPIGNRLNTLLLGKKAYRPNPESNRKVMLPVIRKIEKGKTTFNIIKGYALNSQELGKNHQEQIYDFTPGGDFLKRMMDIYNSISFTNTSAPETTEAENTSTEGTSDKPNFKELEDLNSPIKEVEVKENMGSKVTSQPLKAVIPMRFEDGTGGRSMRPEFKGKSTMDLILSGDRVATSRNLNSSYNNYNLEVGDLIRVTDFKGKDAIVEVTKTYYPVNSISREEWSKLEGWDPKEYDRLVKAGNYYQFQFRLLDAYTPTSTDQSKDFIDLGQERKNLCK